MECTSYCAGRLYDLPLISEFLTKISCVHKIYGDDVLHIELDHLGFIAGDKQGGDVFVFSYGCVILWGLEQSAEEKFLEKISLFLRDPLSEYITDRCYYVVGSQNETYVDEENDTIMLESADAQIKLSFSYGFSQSVKLSAFENSVERTIHENNKIPEELVRTGKISLSRRELARKIGILFVERNFINLNSDILDTPDFFWRRPKYEPYYIMSMDFLDIKQRIEILNTRLDIIHELYEILSTKLHHIHSTRVELTIVALIFIEVVFLILKDLLHII